MTILRPALRPFGVFIKSPPLHFHVFQFAAFSYMLYRLLSRDYGVYGLLPPQAFNYPRGFYMETWPLPPLHAATFQWIYAFLPRPDAEVLTLIQVTAAAACLFGMLGFLPRASAWTAFLVGSHLAGLLQSSNAETDGETLALCALLVLGLSPARAFYRLGQRLRLRERAEDFHWPVFLFMFFCAAYYGLSGLNKLIDIGFRWPWALRLDLLAARGLEKSVFVAERYVHAPTCEAFLRWGSSPVAGLVTLWGELCFPAVLFLPRWRPWLVVSMIVLHVLTYLMAGINFLGNSWLLLVCLDWNALARRMTVHYDGGCGFCLEVIGVLKRLDIFRRLDFVPIEDASARASGLDPKRLLDEMGLVDEAGRTAYGSEAFELLSHSSPALWPLALLYKVPGVPWVAERVYARVAKRRLSAGCRVP